MKTLANLSRQQRIEKILSQRREDLVLVLENLSDWKNISMILRTAESFGMGKVLIVYKKGEKPKISKSISTGAATFLKLEFFTSISSCSRSLKKEGFKIFGTVVNPEVKIVWNEQFFGKVALVMGSESHGLSKRAQKLVDELVYLPMLGLTESLNVSVAAGIFLYEVIRQKEL